MTNKQRAKADSHDRINNFNIANATAIATIPDYADEKTDFDTIHAELITALGMQTNTTGVTASTADAAKSAMADIIIKYALRARIKALRAGNHSLAEQLSNPVTYITQSSKQEAMLRANAIRNLLHDNLSVLTNVTATNITTEIDPAIATYQAIQSQPTTAIQSSKAAGTDKIPSLIIAADEKIDNMHDLLYSYFNTTNPALVNQFSLAMQVITTGVHHTGIAANVTAIVPPATTAAPAEGITMKIIELNKTVTSDIKGIIRLERIKPGTYHAEFSGANMITKTINVTITRGQIIDVNVELQSV
jgi:hypothetical protein